MEAATAAKGVVMLSGNNNLKILRLHRQRERGGSGRGGRFALVISAVVISLYILY